MDTRRKGLPGAPYLGWRRALSEPPPRPLAARLRPYVRALMNVLAVLTGLLIAGFFYTVPVLAVAEVRIEGNRRLAADTVRELANVDGVNMLTLDIPAVRQRLLSDPWIAGAQVRRRLPAIVEVRIEERTAGAVWEAANGRFLVATDGVILEAVNELGELPVIRDGDGGEVRPGQTVAPGPVALASQLVQDVPRALGARAVGFEHHHAGGLLVETDNGWRAAIGDAEALERKLAVWRGIIREATRQGIRARFVDLRFGDRPYLR